VEPQSYTVTIEDGGRGRVRIPVPFDPDVVWGEKPRHHVRGSVGGVVVRGTVEREGDTHALLLGPAWHRDAGRVIGREVVVKLEPEGPQRGDLAPDLAAALEADPVAGAFFDSVAQFYRRGYLRWIDATKRSPEKRAERIAEVVRLLHDGIKQRP
jgi:hypothetical protein